MSHLTAQDKKALSLFKGRLLKLFPDRVHELKVFGSKARGEAIKYSDVDVLVVLEDSARRDRWPLAEIASDIMLETGVDISPKVISRAGVSRLRGRGSPLLRNIDTDGIAL